MKLEIICPYGIGKGTRVYADGFELTGITNINISIPADGIAEVEIKCLALDEKGAMTIKQEDSKTEVIKEALRFTGDKLLLNRHFINEEI